MKNAVCILVISLTFLGKAHAQSVTKAPNDTTKRHKVDSTAKRNEWDVTLDYYTRSEFLGRTDSIGSGYYTPAIAFNLKSGLFFSIYASLFQQNAARHYSGLSLVAGYDKSLSDNFDVNIQFTKNTYPATATRLVNNSVTFEGEAALSYINDIVTSEINFQFLVNKSTLDNSPDGIITVTESHPVYLYALLSFKDSLTITPSVNISAGTQNFYFSYFNAKNLSEHPKRIIKRTKLVSAFKVLDYELSIPVSYYLEHFLVNVTPVYSIGENILGRTTPLSVFSADVGIGYRFW